MRSWFTFCRDRGICILDNSFHQTVDIVSHRPSINGPDGHTGKILSALKEGKCWVSLDDTSDMPFIGIMGKEQLGNEEDPSSNNDLIENMIVVGQEPVYFDTPIPHPLVFPCLARWLLGHNEDVDRYDIGGERISTWLSPANDLFEFRVITKASKEKSTVKTHNPNILRMKVKSPGLTLDKNANVGVHHEYRLPTVIIGKRSKSFASKGATLNQAVGLAIDWRIISCHNDTQLTQIGTPVDGSEQLQEAPIIGVGNKVFCQVDFEDKNPVADSKIVAGSYFELGSE